MLPDRLTWIDETNRADHPFLLETDRCLFFGEYFAGKGYQGGGTNQLIFNFKCKPTVAAANAGRRYWKEQAVTTIAAGLRRAVPQQNAERWTWVPVPPSKSAAHADYDDRLTRALNVAFAGYNADIRLLLRQTQSTEADHMSGSRLSPDELSVRRFQATYRSLACLWRAVYWVTLPIFRRPDGGLQARTPPLQRESRGVVAGSSI